MTEPAGLRYTRDHLWVHPEGSQWRVGVTAFAARLLGEVVFVELPKEGDALERHEPFGTIESVKAVIEVFMPVSGTIAASNNERLAGGPEAVNDDPYDDGWLVAIRPSDVSEKDDLMGADEYAQFVREEEGA